MRLTTPGQSAELTESRRPRNRAANFIVGSVVTGLALAACSAGPKPSARNSVNTVPDKTEISTATTSESTSTTPTTLTTTTLPESVGFAGCAPYFDTSRYKNNEYEVCTAYIVNSANIALQGFYKFGNNRIGYVASAARHRFETRYWDEPRQTEKQQVDAWPQTDRFLGNEVEQSITLVSLSVNLPANKAVLQTQESWKVTAPDGTTLLNEPLHAQDVTMCRGRLPGHVLHSWMVVSHSQVPDFDCINFDRSHGIAP